MLEYLRGGSTQRFKGAATLSWKSWIKLANSPRHRSTKTECDYLNGWILIKTVTYATISPKMVIPRDQAGNAEEEERKTRSQYTDIGLIPGKILREKKSPSQTRGSNPHLLLSR